MGFAEASTQPVNGVFPQPAIAIIEPSVQRVLAIATGAAQVVLK